MTRSYVHCTVILSLRQATCLIDMGVFLSGERWRPRVRAERPATRVTGCVGRPPYLSMRNGSPKYVRLVLFFFGIVADHGGVKPAAGSGGQREVRTRRV